MAEEESFKVTDRRGREPDGESPGSRPGSTAPPSTAPGRAVADPGNAGQEPRRETQEPPAPAQGSVDLQGLFVMFASSALINLGEAADPATGERLVDLDQAKDAIDLLLLLREKTAGNRTEHESRLLEQILYDVQMRYVRAT
ncbi:MAG TPA: DUF1844 domain-containing protein, partial [Methylomirabilota bacterium]|nr:DUF1844 domain-containing protein [Methylomirabilota bacterium]